VRVGWRITSAPIQAKVRETSGTTYHSRYTAEASTSGMSKTQNWSPSAVPLS